MPTDKAKATTTWTSTQAYAIACICLLMGIAVGYLVRGAGQSAAPVQAQAGEAVPPADAAAMQQQPTPEQMKRMADKKAEPLLAQLQSDPNNPQLLAEIGNLYYDTQNYPDAIGYYQKSLALKEDPNVRTDMGTAYYYSGDADTGLAQFSRTLKEFPNFENALFNTGMVKFQAKMDVNGAIAAWEQMLKANPGSPRRAEIEKLIANARQHASVKPGQKTSKPAM
jgi:cytochrome c-type biogenesis protein CcmH/NrfG